MKAEIRFQDKLWGYVEDRGNVLVYSGPSKRAVQEVIESMKRPTGQSAKDFVSSLPQGLRGHVWAKLVPNSVGRASNPDEDERETRPKDPARGKGPGDHQIPSRINWRNVPLP